MKSLKKILHEKGYIQIPLVFTKTNHFEVVAKLNDTEGRFILDTGASNTCVGFDCIKHFDLISKDSAIKASGAGATDMLTQISKKNILQIGDWKKQKVNIVLFDLNHVNSALTLHEAMPVHG